MMKIGIGIGDIAGAPAGVDGLIAQARRAEADGFASGWFANIMGMDAIMAAALCARETKRIELGTAVMPTFPRHPHAMAQQALSAQAIAGGRFTLGIGLSHQIVIEGMLGLSFAKPYSHMKEYLAVLGPLIRSGSVSHWGNEYRVNAQLAVPGGKPCAILVAALAPKMLALTGREAEGTITWMTGPKTIREHTVPRIREAAAQAGRPAPRVVVGLPVAVPKDVAGARARAAAGRHRPDPAPTRRPHDRARAGRPAAQPRGAERGPRLPRRRHARHGRAGPLAPGRGRGGAGRPGRALRRARHGTVRLRARSGRQHHRAEAAAGGVMPRFGASLPGVQQIPARAQGWEREIGGTQIVEAARMAERAGFDWVSCSDHVAVPVSRAAAMGASWFDAGSTLAFVAGATTRIRLLSHVLVLPYRHPLLTAKQHGTLR